MLAPLTPLSRRAVTRLGLMLALGPAPVAVAGLEGPDRMVLPDGRRVRLAGIVVAMPESGGEPAMRLGAEAAEKVGRILGLDAATLELDLQGFDRHGAAVAQEVRSADGRLPDDLVSAGLAWVSGRGEPALLRRLSALEAAARQARSGLWAVPALAEQPAVTVSAEPVRFAVVWGTITEVGTGAPFTYLNFGADWRQDFTARLRASEVRALKRRGADVTKLEGREVRVRGWVTSLNGAMIDIVDAGQIEVLG